MLRRFFFWLLPLAACVSLRPPLSTAPPLQPVARSAWVIFVAEQASPYQRITVRDEAGQMLGRLFEEGWFAVERPSGEQWFFAHPNLEHRPSAPATNTAVGTLRADLRLGHVYVVRMRAYEGTRRSVAQQLRDMRAGCWWEDVDEDWRPEFVDLLAVRPGTADWNHALDAIDGSPRYAVAPRGFDEPTEDVPRWGRARFGACYDAAFAPLEDSWLHAEDGVRTWPPAAYEPSIGHVPREGG